VEELGSRSWHPPDSTGVPAHPGRPCDSSSPASPEPSESDAARVKCHFNEVAQRAWTPHGQGLQSAREGWPPRRASQSSPSLEVSLRAPGPDRPCSIGLARAGQNTARAREPVRLAHVASRRHPDGDGAHEPARELPMRHRMRCPASVSPHRYDHEGGDESEAQGRPYRDHRSPPKKRTGPQPAAAGTPVRSHRVSSARARPRGPKPPGLAGWKPDSGDYLRIVIDFVSLPSHADWIMT